MTFPGSDDIISISDLSKVFTGRKTVTAVDTISFSVRQGEIFGLLGPNGAGKSTLIRILTTLLKPTTGTAIVAGFDVQKDPEMIRTVIGVCPQNSTLDMELTAYDNLEFYGKLTGVSDNILPTRIEDLLKMVNLCDRADSAVSTFSGGMRRKLEIVRAFIHHPRILFLDEPTIGLDPESRREVWNQITHLNRDDTTIILTTHYMDEAEKLCNRIAFMDEGRLISLDTPDNLKHSLSTGDIIEIETGSHSREIIRAIQNMPLVDSVEEKDRKILISSRNGTLVLPGLLAVFERESATMDAISIRTPSLEDVFISLTGRNLAGSGQTQPGIIREIPE
jgi:ABC-2 type transport system ATP-binding protein